MVLFGPGYCGARIAATLVAQGWRVVAVGRDGAGADALHHATHVLSTAPPDDAGDPVLTRHGAAIGRVPWIGYLSSTGVYGDSGGAWVDESAPLGGRRGPRLAADAAWLALGARVLRLPGIYGPGRSVLDRLAAGTAQRIDANGQLFSRVHVDDVVGGVRAAIATGRAGAYNLADDLPAPQRDLIEWAAVALGLPLPPLQSLDTAPLSPAARAFYGENRRVANGKARRLLGWQPLYPDYRVGLRALIATSSPATASAAPAAAAAVHR
ncbi:Rossmann-fold NAD(P)-binding domain-containing protein [Sphingomonas nostoxanthinifaciens]|uniref:SDR family NAD(P)-dependent oxidoreductase n=1 Tax=Sphingomonas nostoxanthinifaciens TaxID=2872652 RepID=UPI001CC1CD08|nr:SDR family NAD(P)-dependent oxidoreductase [Sphingomonas nostoxanthinifaciens]UAK24824.1 SDR family NAD(P)-dependent oxidoreductase [Sphingomonas nostoxanthinifaciens]